MSTIEIILAVAIFLLLLGTWDNSGRIDQLQRRIACERLADKYGSPPAPLIKTDPYKAHSIRLMAEKDEEIKNLKAEIKNIKSELDHALEELSKK